MTAAVRKRTREGEIPKAARSEKCPLLRRKGTWHCARVRQPLGGWHMGRFHAQGVSESPPRPRGLPPVHASRYLCKVHSQTPGSVGTPPHRPEANQWTVAGQGYSNRIQTVVGARGVWGVHTPTAGKSGGLLPNCLIPSFNENIAEPQQEIHSVRDRG